MKRHARGYPIVIVGPRFSSEILKPCTPGQAISFVRATARLTLCIESTKPRSGMRSRAGHCRSRVLCLWRLPYTGLCLPRTIRLVGTEGDMDQACLGLHWRSHLHSCKRLGVRLSRLLLSRAFFHTHLPQSRSLVARVASDACRITS